MSFTINDAKPELKADRKPRVNASAAPKTAPTAGTPADVKKAMATLDSAYNMVATGLMVFGLPDTANVWIESAEQLKVSNEDALKASPKLAKAIASAGSTGGAATLIITHVMAFASVFAVMRAEMQAKRGEDVTSFEPATQGNNERDFTLIPGL